MCRACWVEAGSPFVDNPTVRGVAKLVEELYDTMGCTQGGALHVIVDDENLSDDHFEEPLAHEHLKRDLFPIETKLYEALKMMSYEERYSAVALHAGYLEELPPPLSPGRRASSA